MGKLFGTDGVRGVAGRDLDARLMTSIAAAAATVLAEPGPARPVAVVGRDPRASGEFLEAAVVAGLAGRGVDVLRLGVLPTPAVAYLTDATAADFGVMLSASHNPASDNGIKFFARGGLKLPDHIEDQIEAELAGHGGGGGGHLPAAGFGRVSEAAGETVRYLAHVLSTVESQAPLAGMRIVVDCAHGAAWNLTATTSTQAAAPPASGRFAKPWSGSVPTRGSRSTGTRTGASR